MSSRSSPSIEGHEHSRGPAEATVGERVVTLMRLGSAKLCASTDRMFFVRAVCLGRSGGACAAHPAPPSSHAVLMVL